MKSKNITFHCITSSKVFCIIQTMKNIEIPLNAEAPPFAVRWLSVIATCESMLGACIKLIWAFVLPSTNTFSLKEPLFSHPPSACASSLPPFSLKLTAYCSHTAQKIIRSREQSASPTLSFTVSLFSEYCSFISSTLPRLPGYTGYIQIAHAKIVTDIFFILDLKPQKCVNL